MRVGGRRKITCGPVVRFIALPTSPPGKSRNGHKDRVRSYKPADNTEYRRVHRRKSRNNLKQRPSLHHHQHLSLRCITLFFGCYCHRTESARFSTKVRLKYSYIGSINLQVYKVPAIVELDKKRHAAVATAAYATHGTQQEVRSCNKRLRGTQRRRWLMHGDVHMSTSHTATVPTLREN